MQQYVRDPHDRAGYLSVHVSECMVRILKGKINALLVAYADLRRECNLYVCCRKSLRCIGIIL